MVINPEHGRQIQALEEHYDRLIVAIHKGKALEEFCCLFFSSIPGIEIADRNVLDDLASQELDIVLYNDTTNGLRGLDQILFVEAKNWKYPVGSAEVAWFDWKLRLAGRKHGFLVAMNGITGRKEDRTSAWSIVSQANQEDRRLIILSPAEILACKREGSFQDLVKRKLMLIATQRASL